MGITLSVVFQKKLPKLGTLGGDNMALGEHWDKLDKLLKKAKLTELESFSSADPEEIREMLEDSGMDEEEIAAIAKPKEWYPATKGLEAVRAAIEYLETNENALAKARDNVLEDLKSVEQELVAAEQKGVAFHFCVLD